MIKVLTREQQQTINEVNSLIDKEYYKIIVEHVKTEKDKKMVLKALYNEYVLSRQSITQAPTLTYDDLKEPYYINTDGCITCKVKERQIVFFEDNYFLLKRYYQRVRIAKILDKSYIALVERGEFKKQEKDILFYEKYQIDYITSKRFNYEIYHQLNLTEKQYYRQRRKALLKMCDEIESYVTRRYNLHEFVIPKKERVKI